MTDIEIIGREEFNDLPNHDRLTRLSEIALASTGVSDGHLAVEFVPADRMQQINSKYRGQNKATDVLSFPIDGSAETAGPRELGDVIICPQHTVDIEQALVHGVLHLAGMDHETDDGEMLSLQEEILSWSK